MLFYFESAAAGSLPPTLPSSRGFCAAREQRRQQQQVCVWITKFLNNYRCFSGFCFLHSHVNTFGCGLCLPRFFACQISSVCARIIFCISVFFNCFSRGHCAPAGKTYFSNQRKTASTTLPEFTRGNLRKVRTIMIHCRGCRSIFIKLIKIFAQYCQYHMSNH